MRNLDDWVDVARVPQDDGPHPVVPIGVLGRVHGGDGLLPRGAYQRREAARALALTEDVLALNAARHTAWHFRRRCLEALGADLRRELEFISSDGRGQSQELPDLVSSPRDRRATWRSEAELAFVAQILAEDSKNYHAWSHRQWVTKAHGPELPRLCRADARPRSPKQLGVESPMVCGPQLRGAHGRGHRPARGGVHVQVHRLVREQRPRVGLPPRLSSPTSMPRTRRPRACAATSSSRSASK